MTAIKNLINWLASPAIAVTLSMFGLVSAMFYKPLWTKRGGLVLLATLVGGFAFSFSDPNFRIVATTPDNVPILGMLFLVGFFFWYAMYQAHLNDARLAKGLPPLEGEDSDKKVFSWPDLVYVELISLVVCSIVMIIWSIVLKAPLEEPANPARRRTRRRRPGTSSGSRSCSSTSTRGWPASSSRRSSSSASWRSRTSTRTRGATAISPSASGSGRSSMFCFGFIILWVVLIILGTFLRGPNWNFFGPYEVWDPNKLVPLNNVSVSEIFWVKWLQDGASGVLAQARVSGDRPRRPLHRAPCRGSCRRRCSAASTRRWGWSGTSSA